MEDKLQSVSISSGIIISYYDKLRKLSFNNQEDSQEYEYLVHKLKRFVQGEASIYDELSDEEINNAIQYFKIHDINGETESRMYSKLNQQYRKRNYNNFTIQLSNLITSKIMIDVLKMVTNKLLKLSTTSDLDSEEIDILFTYNDVYKYNYLTINEYIEKIALEYKFCVLAIPTMDFKDIEKAFNADFIDKSGNITFDYIKDSIEELLKADTDDKYLYMFITLFEMSRIEVMLPYLNKEKLNELSLYLNSLNIKDEDLVIKKIRKLIKKRKEEFEI